MLFEIPPQNECLPSHGLLERKKQFDDIRAVDYENMFNLAHKEHIYGLMKPYVRFSSRNDMFRSSVF